jgi:hypothetical protein
MICTGSKDNISAVIVQLPGAFMGIPRQDNNQSKRSSLKTSSKARNSSKSDDEDIGAPPSGNL